MAIQRYRFVLDYRSGAGVWTKGQVVELEPGMAAWFNRDIPGCLVAADAPPVETAERAVDAPPADRQVKRPAQKRGA